MAGPPTRKISQRQYLVSISGIAGYGRTKSGGNITADATKIRDGGTLKVDVLASPFEIENITVSRAWDFTRDAAVLAYLRQRVGRHIATSITVTATDRDLIR